MTRVLATGTFDLLHPGHTYFLEEAKSLGDELYVIIARDSMVNHKDSPVLHEDQRREMVSALKPVDTAILGSEESIFNPLSDIDPDIIALGHDQRPDKDELESELLDRGFDIEVARIGLKQEPENHIYSTRRIIQRVLDRRG